MPLIETKGAASAQGFGEFAQSGAVNYIEDVFSTYLYTGNASTQTITNGIDLSTKGGMVWIKNRSLGGTNHALQDTVRGRNNILFSNTTDGNQAYSTSINSFNSTGFTLGSENLTNQSGQTFVSWTFREQPKFFDVVTYTGDGANRTISHNLGSVPGCIIVKRTDASADWQVYHRSLANTEYLVLNSTAAKATGTTRWNSTTPTSTVFSLGTDTTVNANGGTYVAYLFAHDAGGFGLSGSDNVISCGSFTTAGTTANVSLGWEPQYVMLKRSSATSDWFIFDTMRGFVASPGSSSPLSANTSAAEDVNGGALYPTATGFQYPTSTTGDTWIYIAIRRGPMKVPTSGTSVFMSTGHNGTGSTNNTVTFDPVPYVDLTWIKSRNTAGTKWAWTDRLRGATQELDSSAATAETTYSNDVTGFDFMSASGQSIRLGSGASGNVNTSTYTYWDVGFRRAPGFFDEVCYTGTGSSNTISHNLNVAPELIIIKSRGNSTYWDVYCQYAPSPTTKFLSLDSTNGSSNVGLTWISSINSSSFTLGAWDDVNSSVGYNYVAYLFATCAGVSKVGSYTGTGTTMQIDCGFTGGSRFVLIKRTDSTGDWYVWDSARGIVAGNDPYLLLNSTAAEVTNTDYVDTYSAGFEISSTAPAAINANGGTFIFLAIA